METDTPQKETRPEPAAVRDSAGARQRPALVITVQSWATPLVGVVMLALGLLAGYFGRPLLAPEPAPQAEAAVPAERPESQAAAQAEIMEAVVGQTRHFKGDAGAPVTIIEFSDFQ